MREIVIPNTGILKQNNVLSRLPLKDVTNSGKDCSSRTTARTVFRTVSDSMVYNSNNTNNKDQTQSKRSPVYVDIINRNKEQNVHEQTITIIDLEGNSQKSWQVQNSTAVLKPTKTATYGRFKANMGPSSSTHVQYKQRSSLAKVEVFDDDDSSGEKQGEGSFNHCSDSEIGDSDNESLTDLDWLQENFALTPLLSAIDSDEAVVPSQEPPKITENNQPVRISPYATAMAIAPLEPGEPPFPPVNHVPEIIQGFRRPNYTYGQMIEFSLREHRQLTVNSIYNWIIDRFPYYKVSDKRWKNSIRHQLSINPTFTKGTKAHGSAGPVGHGCYWMLANPETRSNKLPIPQPHWKKKKLEELQLKYIEECNRKFQQEKEITRQREQLSATEILDNILINDNVGKKVEVQYLTSMYTPAPSHTDLDQCWDWTDHEAAGAGTDDDYHMCDGDGCGCQLHVPLGAPSSFPQQGDTPSSLIAAFASPSEPSRAFRESPRGGVRCYRPQELGGGGGGGGASSSPMLIGDIAPQSPPILGAGFRSQLPAGKHSPMFALPSPLSGGAHGLMHSPMLMGALPSPDVAGVEVTNLFYDDI